MSAIVASAVADALRSIEAELSVLQAATAHREVSRLSLSLTIEGIRARVVAQANELDEIELNEESPIPYRLTMKETA
jgi:hypothetical protein